MTQAALHLDGPAQQASQLPGYGQAQPGAAIAAGGAAVHLLEGLEDHLLHLGLYAYAGVLDRYGQILALFQAQPGGIQIRARPVENDVHPAFLGELHGIGHKVLEYLLDAFLIAVELRQGLGRYRDFQLQPLLLGHVAESGQHPLSQVGSKHLGGAQLNAPGLYLGQVQNLVYQVEQVAAAGMDDFGELNLLRAEVALLVV